MYVALAQLALSSPLVHSLLTFARAGGGGSGSGGGGSIGALALVGYLPMHPVGALVRKHKMVEAEWVGGQVIGWVICVIYTALLAWMTVFIGGLALIMAAGAPLGMGAGLYRWFSKLKQSKKTALALQAAAQADGVWNKESVLARAREVFTRYQKDWSSFNVTSMQSYMTPEYYNHAGLMMYALRLAGRQNLVNDPKIEDALIVSVNDSLDNSKDEVIVGITASSNDVLKDTRDQTELFTDDSTFTEYWRFQRSGNDWLLEDIQQATAATWTRNVELEAFAVRNGYYFSLDWGWLLLPRRGQLFGQGKFGKSDINNHVIGMHGQCLVQFYTYRSKPDEGKTYLIAQANLPKSYGDIVVRHKKRLSFGGIHGLKKISTEWPDFNKKYQVYATSLEQATSLELLNPKYMEQLEALPFEVNIEVVDNVVYLYAPQRDKAAAADRYPRMLDALNSAFKEMRL